MPSAYETELYSTAVMACGRCAEIASRQLRSLRGGRNAFYPIVHADEGKFGVGVIDQYEYLVYQNDGFSTFVMTSLAGRVVPMLINGQRVFRYASKSRIGRFRSGHTTYWRRDSSGNIIGSGEQRRSWVHPGLPTKGFIEQGVKEVALEKANDLYRALLEDFGL